MGQVGRFAWYRFRTTIRRRGTGYVALTLLVGSLGGLALASVAGARRTQSSYPAFFASTHPSDMTFPTALYGLDGATSGYAASRLTRIAHLPHVRHLESSAQLNNAALAPDGSEIVPKGPLPANFEVSTEASVDGLGFDQDRVTITQGRAADPARADEMVMSAAIARLLHFHLGEVLPMGFYTNAQEAAPGPSGDEWRPHPYRTVAIRIVGFGVQNTAIVQDDVDAQASNFVLFTPALTRRLVACCASSTTTAAVLDHGARDSATVESELARINPVLATHVTVSSGAIAKAERAVEPESIALAVFGGIAALTVLVLATQAIARLLRVDREELDTVRALGATPAMTATSALVGALGAITGGVVVAGLVALALSPLAPFGPARHVYPHRGITLDATVVGFGMLVLLGFLGVAAALLAARDAVHHAMAEGSRRRRASWTAGASYLPTPALTGVRFALDPGRRRRDVPVRSAVVGTALAIAVVVGTLTFGASLHVLVSRPALYGWNWNDELSGGGGVGAVPRAQAESALRRDHDLAAWSGVYFSTARIQGLTVPLIGATPGAAVAPPLLSGRGLERANEIVLGATTLAELHRQVGDTVEVDTGARAPTRLTIAGTASLPAIGGSGAGSAHLEMGTGAVLDASLLPEGLRNAAGNRPKGPNAIFVRFRPGVNRAAAVRGLDRIADSLSLPTNWGVTVTPVQHPAEISNDRSIDGTPLVLGGALALGALFALGLTLVASVRSRRYDLALLKTFGFTRRQLAAVVAWQATTAVLIGVVVGVPVGIIAGRSLWELFAREIHAVPRPSVPTGAIFVIALGALVLANLVAAVPGRHAARTRITTLLRGD